LGKGPYLCTVLLYTNANNQNIIKTMEIKKLYTEPQVELLEVKIEMSVCSGEGQFGLGYYDEEEA